MNYPLASPGVFRTIQGEGALMGYPMIFVRLAGCSIGCHQCDTDYKTGSRLDVSEIAKELNRIHRGEQWVFITGGEPADHDLGPLVEKCRLFGHVAMVTSGHKPLGGVKVDYLMVSPHGRPKDFVLTNATHINLVPGLNGLTLSDWKGYDFSRFNYKWVTPLHGSQESMASCTEWLEKHADWRLGIQAHKHWGIA